LDALQTIDATDLDDAFQGFKSDQPASDNDDSAAMMRTERPFFFRKMGPPRQDDFFQNSVLAGVFTDNPFPTTSPQFFLTPFVPESAEVVPPEPSAPETEPLPPLEPSAPDGLMTPEELALLNKLLVTDDMTPEGRIDIYILLKSSKCVLSLKKKKPTFIFIFYRTVSQVWIGLVVVPLESTRFGHKLLYVLQFFHSTSNFFEAFQVFN